MLIACHNRAGSKDCKGKSETQCAWEQAEGAAQPSTPGISAPTYNPRDPLTPTTQDDWDRATQVLGEAWTMMGEGVDREALAQVARNHCAEDPATRGGDTGSWTCQLTEAPVLAGRAFILEVGGDGVIALTAFNLGEGEASGLLRDAIERWSPLCSEEFAPYPPSQVAGEFTGCVLNEGPLLVLSRFRPDPEASLWQVSLAVMPAG